jgi:OmpA-OmpF porin, OOP family
MKNVLALALFAMLPFAGSALAQDAHHFYVGGQLGQAKVKDFCDGTSGTGISCDEKDMSWKILGGYQVNRNFSVELGYIDFGKVKAHDATDTVTVKAHAFDLMGVGILPFADRFSVYGKLGVYHGTADAHVRLGSLGVSDSESDDSTDLTFGLGASFDITRQVTARAEWQRYSDVGGSDIGKTDVDVISLGVLFHF